MIQILRAGGRTDGSTREVVEEVLADLKIKMGFITVHQKWGKKRGDKLQNFLPLESFPQFQFRELRILLRGSNNCLGHTYFYPIGFPLQFSHISFKFFLFTNSFVNNCLQFSHIQYQIEFHFFCNLSLNFCNSAQNSWPIQTLWGQQTKNRNLFAAKHWRNENIKLGILRLFLTAKLWFWLRGICSSEGLAESINIGDEKKSGWNGQA